MPSVFGCISSGSRYGNIPNELVYRAGPPFLDNHYRGYQGTVYITHVSLYIHAHDQPSSICQKQHSESSSSDDPDFPRISFGKKKKKVSLLYCAEKLCSILHLVSQ